MAVKRNDGAEVSMAVGASIVLIVAGAVLAWRVGGTAAGTTLLGAVLMVLGLTGLLVALLEARPRVPQRRGALAEVEDWRIGREGSGDVRRRND
ncbi:MAG: hypothetical protein KY396_03500 [Actinobacteria bacterium]|nr:hypothetical protein [Actinomycetota bacterium]